ncbi:ATPase family associated with various cellular activities (AAA) [Pseudovibrio denitrificans]|uniref:ATPase family associated with various cellular activities (AAA) n=1 Tax=Pseudovibrio denitrificans TaxID=258256 RepID=A0A1I7APJ0_9HYPH|nr:ATP-binding protein [Pseudovibrio denitrificans]SFT76849.1 ATPase family associated with various cellular activities (AAA) [Pseudovibrio denitrificans]
MSQSLSEEIQPLIEIWQQNPNSVGSLRAVLILLEQSPDSGIIIETLGSIDTDQVLDQAIREKAATLLREAGSPELGEKWEPPLAKAPATNVIPLNTQDEIQQLSPKGITFNDVGGLEDVKKQVRRKIINPFQNKRALFSRFKRKAGGGVLMYGPPGCGKTMLARALASECNAQFVNVNAADILDQFVGNAEKRIKQLFEDARNNRPVVLFFDEVEALAQKRQFESSAKVNTTVSALLTEMDGFQEDNEGVLFLGATNVPWSLDSAFRRPGRFDRTIFVPPPDRVARKFILARLLQDRPVEKGLDTKPIIENSSGFSGADLSALVDTAIDIAIEESSSSEDLRPLSNEHFKEAFYEVKSTVGEWLGQARSFAKYANENGMYDDLASFLKKYAR